MNQVLIATLKAYYPRNPFMAKELGTYLRLIGSPPIFWKALRPSSRSSKCLNGVWRNLLPIFGNNFQEVLHEKYLLDVIELSEADDRHS